MSRSLLPTNLPGYEEMVKATSNLFGVEPDRAREKLRDVSDPIVWAIARLHIDANRQGVKGAVFNGHPLMDRPGLYVPDWNDADSEKEKWVSIVCALSRLNRDGTPYQPPPVLWIRQPRPLVWEAKIEGFAPAFVGWVYIDTYYNVRGCVQRMAAVLEPQERETVYRRLYEGDPLRLVIAQHEAAERVVEALRSYYNVNVPE